MHSSFTYFHADASVPCRGSGSQHAPFALEIREEDQPLYQFNHRGFLKIEYFRTKEDIVCIAAVGSGVASRLS